MIIVLLEIQHKLQEDDVTFRPVLVFKFVQPLQFGEQFLTRLTLQFDKRQYRPDTVGAAFEGAESSTGAAVAAELPVPESGGADPGEASP